VAPEEEGSDVREMVWEMSRTTNRILIFGIILILAILAALIYLGIITFSSVIRLVKMFNDFPLAKSFFAVSHNTEKLRRDHSEAKDVCPNLIMRIDFRMHGKPKDSHPARNHTQSLLCKSGPLARPFHFRD